jgi:hypothetical protein
MHLDLQQDEKCKYHEILAEQLGQRDNFSHVFLGGGII